MNDGLLMAKNEENRKLYFLKASGQPVLGIANLLQKSKRFLNLKQVSI